MFINVVVFVYIIFVYICLTFSSNQAEIVRKKDTEITKLRKDIEILTIQYESTESSMRKKHQEAYNDLSDQIDYLSKTKNRFAKNK